MRRLDWTGWPSRSSGSAGYQEILEKNRPVYEQAKACMDGQDDSYNREKEYVLSKIKEIVFKYHGGAISEPAYALGVMYQLIQQIEEPRLVIAEYETKMKLYDAACRREDSVKALDQNNTANP